jgi:hypothetical protein
MTVPAETMPYWIRVQILHKYTLRDDIEFGLLGTLRLTYNNIKKSKHSQGRPRRRWDENSKMDVREVG